MDRSDSSRASVEAPNGSPDIAKATIACRESLTQCLDIRALKVEWAEDRLADFRLWDASIGASSDLNRRSALENRLKPKTYIRRAILDLLGAFKVAVDQCKELGKKCDRLEEAGNSLRSFEPLLEAVEAADTLLNDLVRLSTIIWKASRPSRNSRADTSFYPDDPELLALRQHLNVIILSRPEGRDDDGPQGQLTDVQLRLIDANLRRNHRFREAHKLDLHKSGQPAVDARPEFGSGKSFNLNRPEGTIEAFTPKLSRRFSPTLETQTALRQDPVASGLNRSETMPSIIDSKILAQRARSITTSRQSGTKATTVVARIKSQYPRPPNVKINSNLFKCPCCCVVLKKEEYTGHHGFGSLRWRKHIASDLLPYVCVLDNCLKPEKLYTEKEEWIQHMTEDHEFESYYWECALCDERPCYISKSTLEDHLDEKHDKAIADVPTFVDACANPRILDGMSCPLCSFVGERDEQGYEKDVTGKELLAHVAEHVHSFALNSLPLLYNEKGERYEFFEQNEYFAESGNNSYFASGRTISDAKDMDNALSTFEGTESNVQADKELENASLGASRDELTVLSLQEWNKLQPFSDRDFQILSWRADTFETMIDELQTATSDDQRTPGELPRPDYGFKADPVVSTLALNVSGTNVAQREPIPNRRLPEPKETRECLMCKRKLDDEQEWPEERAKPWDPVARQGVSTNADAGIDAHVNVNVWVEDRLHQLPPLPNPLPERHPQFEHSMPPAAPRYCGDKSVYLAGSIEEGKALPWQRQMVVTFQDLPITIINPRSHGWEEPWEVDRTRGSEDAVLRQQTMWESNGLEKADFICFFFDANTVDIIPLFELGLWAHSSKAIVCCDPRYWRAGNVHLVCERYGVPLVEKFEDLVVALKSRLVEEGLRLD